MKSYIVMHKSLSFDTVLNHHKTRDAAEAEMLRELTHYGDWPRDQAVEAAKRGTPVLVVDNGDDHTVEIRIVEAA